MYNIKIEFIGLIMARTHIVKSSAWCNIVHIQHPNKEEHDQYLMCTQVAGNWTRHKFHVGTITVRLYQEAYHM